MVHLSRTKAAMVASQKGAGNDFAGGGLVSGHNKPFRCICGVYTRLQWRLQASYEFVGMVNHQERFPSARWCPFQRSLPIAINKRYHDRLGKLDFYVQETLPGRGQS